MTTARQLEFLKGNDLDFTIEMRLSQLCFHTVRVDNKNKYLKRNEHQHYGGDVKDLLRSL
jgi:hypothetical protein